MSLCFFRKTDCVHYPNRAEPALPLLLRRERPPKTPPFSSPLLHHRWDNKGQHPKKAAVLQAMLLMQHIQIHTHLWIYTVVAADIYTSFVFYVISSVMAITFVDNHFHSGVVIPLAFFPCCCQHFGHVRHVTANKVINLYVGFYVGYKVCVYIYKKEKWDDCISFGSLI